MYKYLIILYFLIFSLTGAYAQAPAGRVSALAGGIGSDSVHALRELQREFNIKFVFTLLEGDYVADVAVKIADSRGHIVLEQLADGPLLLARLPAGRYLATLTYAGVTQTRNFTARGGVQQTIQTRWPRSAADGPPYLL